MADGDDPKVPPPEHRWKPGESGNPSGRHKELPGFRTWCRKLSRETASKIIHRIRTDDCVSVGDMIAAFKAFADRGGFLPTDRQAAIETGQARLVLAMAALEVLSPPERAKLLAAMERSLDGTEGDVAA